MEDVTRRSPNARRRPRLGRRFFDRRTRTVARELLGAHLLVGPAGRRVRVEIVECEAYVAGDPANHADRGPTPRNRSMFARPGTLYVYRIHRVVCANVVTRPGEAVLLRAARPLTPIAASTRGPGRLARALGWTHADDGTDTVRSPKIAWYGRREPPEIVTGPRVGIRRAAEAPLRFAVRGSPWVSSPRPGRRSRATTGA
ncbi:MAG: DNA-3-methyladenine glycosylase [Thermoplasmata archaeon]